MTTRAEGAQSPLERPVRVLTYNIHHGADADGKYDLEAIAEVIRAAEPDLVGLQEVDRTWGPRSAFEDQPARLAALTGLHPCFGPNLDRDGAQYGNLILSRFPILESQNSPLPAVSSKSEQRGLLRALVEVDSAPVRFCVTHLEHTSAEDRAAQVAAVLEALHSAREPCILTGDFNTQPAAPELRPLLVELQDAWEASGAPGPGHTFPSGASRSRIDYILVPMDAAVLEAMVLSTHASDHLPVLAQVRLAKQGVAAER